MSKTVNYTAEMTAELVEAYKAAGSNEARDAVVASFAEKFAKSVASIRAKLSREKVYVKAERTAKDGSPVVRKDALATEIGEALGLAEGDTDSLAKATKRALVAIREVVIEG